MTAPDRARRPVLFDEHVGCARATAAGNYRQRLHLLMRSIVGAHRAIWNRCDGGIPQADCLEWRAEFLRRFYDLLADQRRPARKPLRNRCSTTGKRIGARGKVSPTWARWHGNSCRRQPVRSIKIRLRISHCVPATTRRATPHPTAAMRGCKPVPLPSVRDVVARGAESQRFRRSGAHQPSDSPLPSP